MKRLVACILGLFILAAVVDSAAQMSRAAQRIVYIGTYTGEASKGIYAFRFDDGSGELTPLGLVAETPSPSFLTASTNGRFVFAVNELQSFGGASTGSVTSFAVDPAKLTEINVQLTEGAGPCHLVLDRTGRYLAVANYGGGNFALLPVATDGRLQPATSVVTGQGAESGAAKPLGHALARDYAPAAIETAAAPVRVEKRRGPVGLEYRVVGIVWGGLRSVDRLAIRFGPGEGWRPFSICPAPGTHEIWSLWEYRWKPAAPGRYDIALRVPDPSVPQRRLDTGYYMRQVTIDEI